MNKSANNAKKEKMDTKSKVLSLQELKMVSGGNPSIPVIPWSSISHACVVTSVQVR